MTVLVPLKYRKRIPPIHYEDKHAALLFQALDAEFALHQSRIEDMRDQFFIHKATWGLAVWEKLFGLPIGVGTYEERRLKVFEKYYARLPFTPSVLLALANHVSQLKNAQVEEVFDQKIIRFIFQLEDAVDVTHLYKTFMKMRRVHVHGFSIATNADETIEIDERITCNLRRYHTVEEFQVGMTPLKYEDEVTLA